MSSEIVFELCVERLDAYIAARQGGADRIELCSGLSEGGLTPSHALTQAAIRQSGLPVYVLLRPRGGNFLYSDREFALIEEDLAHARQLGASGFVAGVLTREGRVDRRRMRRLVELAGPLEVTFHRAFDSANDLEGALEDVIASGCRRVLSAGGASNVSAGADRLRTLVAQAAGRIAIAAGGGLRVDNAAEIARRSGTCHFHGSMRRWTAGDGSGMAGSMVADVSDIRAVILELRGGRWGKRLADEGGVRD
jgi:copper homeostasis protein